MTDHSDPITKVGSMVSQELVDVLREGFPRLHPTPGTPMDQIMYNAGTVRLIDYLQSCLDHVTAQEEHPDVL